MPRARIQARCRRRRPKRRKPFRIRISKAAPQAPLFCFVVPPAEVVPCQLPACTGATKRGAELSSGRSVGTTNSGSLFRDPLEFARRPGAYGFYFGQRTACRDSHAYSDRIRSISELGNEHDVV